MQIYFSYISIWHRSSLPELYNSRREVQCSHGLMFIDFSSSLGLQKTTCQAYIPVTRAATDFSFFWAGTLNAVLRRLGTREPLWCFCTTLHIFPRLSQRLSYCCHSSGANVLSTWKWLTLISLLLFRFIPSFPDAHLALAFKLLRWAALQSEAEKSQLAC